MDLRGKVGIVTGSSKGIGYAIAESLARAGSHVIVCARNAEELASAARDLNALGEGRVIGVPCDVGEYDDVRRLISHAVEEFDRIDILVNNAGVGEFGAVDELTCDQWDQVIGTNLSGVFYACHEAIPHMKRGKGGWIINIASLAGKNPFAGGAAYNASKFGLVGFSEAMMMDVRHDGIRVSYIMPGSVSTHFRGHTPGDEDAWKIQPEDVAGVVMDLLATPERTLPSRVEMRPSRPPKK
jgi:NAD(P)-dependent dehydrogenase (short-subunit alcohol dehydrogenase family)